MNPATAWSERQDKPECVCTLEDAVLAAVHDLHEKGRAAATYNQIRRHDKVADWVEGNLSRMTTSQSAAVAWCLVALEERGVLVRTGEGWSSEYAPVSAMVRRIVGE